MTHLTVDSTQRIPYPSPLTPLRVVATAVLLALGIGGSALLYGYLTTPTPMPTTDAMIFPRLPMHPF